MEMGGVDHQAIPILLEFPEDIQLFQTTELSSLCGKVREACEKHGFFLMQYRKCVPKTRRNEMIEAMKTFFDLPEETKRRYHSHKPYQSYIGNCPIVPLHQSFGIDDADENEIAQQFTNLMWPDGNPAFWMILSSFNVSDDPLLSSCTATLRLMKYNLPNPPPNGPATTAIGLVPHTDKNAITILCQNEVQGLEVILGGDHKWVPVTVPEDAFIVVVGDALKAWSNGRLHAVKHRVVMKGEKERYSWAVFSIPKDAVTICAPNELVDTQHPLRYRPFRYADYISYFMSNVGDEDALETYAGL